MFERYNGKPTLMTKSSRIVQGPGYFEMDVSEPPHTLTTKCTQRQNKILSSAFTAVAPRDLTHTRI